MPRQRRASSLDRSGGADPLGIDAAADDALLAEDEGDAAHVAFDLAQKMEIVRRLDIADDPNAGADDRHLLSGLGFDFVRLFHASLPRNHAGGGSGAGQAVRGLAWHFPRLNLVIGPVDNT